MVNLNTKIEYELRIEQVNGFVRFTFNSLEECYEKFSEYSESNYVIKSSIYRIITDLIDETRG